MNTEYTFGVALDRALYRNSETIMQRTKTFQQGKLEKAKNTLGQDIVGCHG